jgi:hypothetical protein
LDSDVASVATFGPLAPPDEGDHDYVQLVFFEVPEAPDDTLYIRIFDADTGGANDEIGLVDGIFNTVMTYTVRGGPGPAYSHADARAHAPGRGGINAGTFITQQSIGIDIALDDRWLALPVNRSQGELIGGSRIFKLAVQGASGDDGNWYQVAISSDPFNNVGVPGSRIFAFSWCVALPGRGAEVSLYPYVPAGATRVTQVNFDFDVSPGAAITLTTPMRDLAVSSLSGGGVSASQEFLAPVNETSTTWSAHYVLGDFSPPRDHFSLWFFDDTARALAVFTTPTLLSAPPAP